MRWLKKIEGIVSAGDSLRLAAAELLKKGVDQVELSEHASRLRGTISNLGLQTGQRALTQAQVLMSEEHLQYAALLANQSLQAANRVVLMPVDLINAQLEKQTLQARNLAADVADVAIVLGGSAAGEAINMSLASMTFGVSYLVLGDKPAEMIAQGAQTAFGPLSKHIRGDAPLFLGVNTPEGGSITAMIYDPNAQQEWNGIRFLTESELDALQTDCNPVADDIRMLAMVSVQTEKARRGINLDATPLIDVQATAKLPKPKAPQPLFG